MPGYAGQLGHAFRIACFVYDADVHCVDCAMSRFGAHRLRPDSPPVFDGEGNEVLPVYAFEESADSVRVCANCGGYIDDEHV